MWRFMPLYGGLIQDPANRNVQKVTWKFHEIEMKFCAHYMHFYVMALNI